MPETPPVLLASSYQYDMESREEWDPETVLYQPYEVEQSLLPDISNCMTVQVYLKMLGLPFSIVNRPNAEHMSPTGKVPFIKCGSFLVAELDPIIAFVQSKGISLTKNLDPTQLSNMRAFMSVVNTVFGNAETYIVWCDPDVLPNTKRRYGSVYPFPLNHWVTFLKKRTSIARLDAVRWLEKSIDEVCDEVDQGCKALSNRLGDSPYFFSEPTELDALVFGHIYMILTTPLAKDRFAAIVCRYNNLTKHCKRIQALYFDFREPVPT